MITFKYDGGALTCNCVIPEYTENIDGSTAIFYGNNYIIAESMNLKTAILLASTLAKKWNSEYKVVGKNNEEYAFGGP